MRMYPNHYPEYYYMRPGPEGESDRDWVMVRMLAIPDDKQQEIAEEYDKLFRRQGRKEANTYLHNIAKQYRDKKLRK